MNKITINKTHVSGGMSIFTLAIILMVAGFVMENQDIYVEYNGLGNIIFTVGFWLFFIPLIIIGVILGVFLILMVAFP